MVEIRSYDPGWPEQAERARTELGAALPGVFVAVEHIGSTSVPGLAAKPVIDLMASVRDLAAVSDREEALRGLGYRFGDTGMTGRLFYHRDAWPSVNLHVVTTDTWDARNERLLRDYLRAHPDDAREYGELKSRLAADGSSGEAYTRAKTELIQRIVDAVRDERGLPRVPVWEE